MEFGGGFLYTFLYMTIQTPNTKSLDYAKQPNRQKFTFYPVPKTLSGNIHETVKVPRPGAHDHRVEGQVVSLRQYSQRIGDARVYLFPRLSLLIRNRCPAVIARSTTRGVAAVKPASCFFQNTSAASKFSS